MVTVSYMTSRQVSNCIRNESEHIKPQRRKFDTAEQAAAFIRPLLRSLYGFAILDERGVDVTDSVLC